jgi:hypothetical protein
MVKQAVALVLCATVASGGCASAGRTRVESSPAFGPTERAEMADYVQKLPAGSRVRVERVAGGAVKGTLMKASDTSILVQRNTRMPEAPMDIPLEQVTRVTLDTGSSTGKAIAIGAAVGAAATFGVLLLIAALSGWD